MTTLARLLCLTTLLVSFEECASVPRTRRESPWGALQDENSSATPVLTPSPTSSNPPTQSPTSPTNQTGSTSPAPSAAPTSSGASATTEVPTVAPDSSGTTTSPTAVPAGETTAPTTAPVPTTAPTAAPATPPATAPRRMSVLRFIEKTIALFIMFVLALLGFGAIMNNRYRIYFFLRGVWYTILGMECTHWIMRKLGLRSYQPVDGGLNTVIFENEMDEGLLMRETDT